MLQTMSGISAIDAQPIASALSEMPGPALPVTARYPEYENPRASDTAPSSSSACTKIPPYFGNSRRRVSMMDDHGVIGDRKSTRLNSSHLGISYAVFCLKKKINM